MRYLREPKAGRVDEVFYVQEQILLRKSSASSTYDERDSLPFFSAVQSEACQKKDWKSHKYNCSLLPLGTLTRRVSLSDQSQQQLDTDVERVSELLLAWRDAYEPMINLNGRNSTARIPEDDSILGM